jgi:hypothetical protein
MGYMQFGHLNHESMKRLSESFYRPLVIGILILITQLGYAQTAIHDGSGTGPAASAMLDVQATNKGVLIPRVDIDDLATAAPVTAPADGLLVYNTDATTGPGYFYWEVGSPSKWVQLLNSNTVVSGSSFWTQSGSDLYPNNTAWNVGIGMTSPTYKLHVGGRIKTNAVNESSDERLKTDINPIGNALGKVLKMNGVTYEWRVSEFPEMGFDKGLQYGLIAQELEQIVPELVGTDNEGWKSIEYSHLVPLLIEALKEQQLQMNERDLKIQNQTVKIEMMEDEFRAEIGKLRSDVLELRSEMTLDPK